MIDIKGLDKKMVLCALVNATRPMGMGFLQDIGRPLTPADVPDYEGEYVDYVVGKPIKCDLSDGEFDPWLYDRDAGAGAAERAIAVLRAVGRTVKKAEFVRNIEGWRGDAKLYRLHDGAEIRYVVVSAVVAMFSGPETFIFASDRDGTVTSYSDLDGSFQGGLDHVRALNGAGYEVVNEPPTIDAGTAPLALLPHEADADVPAEVEDAELLAGPDGD